jgi:hypothetical protein
MAVADTPAPAGDMVAATPPAMEEIAVATSPAGVADASGTAIGVAAA